MTHQYQKKFNYRHMHQKAKSTNIFFNNRLEKYLFNFEEFLNFNCLQDYQLFLNNLKALYFFSIDKINLFFIKH